MELILSLLSEDLLLKYITFRLLYLVPYFAAFLFVLLHMKLYLKVNQKWYLARFCEALQNVETFIFSPILKWRIKCLTKMSDEVDAPPIY
ncbi:hypothetical protein [Macrococcus animalis]|uniref:hypothetical protein n=1 Tax=Macrococcus animalis TaxID=3395467 RepID=UPI0039BE50D9